MSYEGDHKGSPLPWTTMPPGKCVHIALWHDRDISTGSEWEQEISEHLNTAQIILLFVSPDFMASDYCYSIEMKRALERHQRKEARVIPVILRPIDWQDILGDIQALPTDAKPVLSPFGIVQKKRFMTWRKVSSGYANDPSSFCCLAHCSR